MSERVAKSPELRFELFAAFERALARNPHQRICQLIVNATGQDDPFYVEDRALIDSLNQYGAQL